MDAVTRLARIIASGFGLGHAPVAPGTVASAAAVAVGWILTVWSPWALPSAALLVTAGGLWAVRAARAQGDPGWIVIDEVAGQWIAMLGLGGITPIGALAAFGLFRLFDILKPGPVGWADRWHTPAGVMADDVIAGGMAMALLWIARLVVAF